MITPQVALLIDRLCFDASAIAIYGRCGFIAWIAPQPLGRLLAISSRRWARAALFLAVAAALAWLPLEAATSGEKWSYAVDSDMLSTLLFGTGVGGAWSARVMLAVALFAASCFFSVRVQFVISALLLSSLSLGGHARMDSGLLGILHVLNDALHLLAGGAWLGGLVLLPVCLAQLRDRVLSEDARVALRRFSSAGHFAVALVVATGVINAMLVLPLWPIHLASPYRALLAAKISLVAAMTGLALINRYFLVPRMRAQRDLTIVQIRACTMIELALGLGVLALVSALGILDPM